MSEALRSEVRPFGVHVSLIEPGFVKTNLLGHPPAQGLPDYDVARAAALEVARVGVERGLDANLVAQTILRVATAARPGLRYRVGTNSAVLVMLKRLLPEPAFERVSRRIFQPSVR